MRKRLLKTGLSLSVLLFVLLLALRWYQRQLLINEQHLQLGELARLTCVYIERNSGAYPSSWQDLISQGLLIRQEGGDCVSGEGESQSYPYLDLVGKVIRLSEFKITKQGSILTTHGDRERLLIKSSKYADALTDASAQYSQLFEKAAKTAIGK